MKQLFQFAPFLFCTADRFEVLKKIGPVNRDHLETICQDADGAYFLSTVIEEISTSGEVKRKRIVYEETINSDYDDFVQYNAISCENCKIYLN